MNLTWCSPHMTRQRRSLVAGFWFLLACSSVWAAITFTPPKACAAAAAHAGKLVQNALPPAAENHDRTIAVANDDEGAEPAIEQGQFVIWHRLAAPRQVQAVAALDARLARLSLGSLEHCQRLCRFRP
jgi:hypothetical protein